MASIDPFGLHALRSFKSPGIGVHNSDRKRPDLLEVCNKGSGSRRSKAYDLWPIAETFGVFVFGASAMAQEPEPVAPVGHRS
jgi:hypothetical protein